MKLNRFIDETNFNYRFYDEEKVIKRGYAIYSDEIISIAHFDDEEYKVYSDLLNIQYRFNNIDEVVNYKCINGYTIGEMIEQLEEIVAYHVRTAID